MEIIVKNKEELKEIIDRTNDKTAFVIRFEEEDKNEGRRSEKSGA